MPDQHGEAGVSSAVDPDEIDEAALEAVMQDVPRGAIVLSGSSVVLLMICWFLIYAFVFLPRGTVG